MTSAGTEQDTDHQDWAGGPDGSGAGPRTRVAGLNSTSPLARRLLRQGPAGLEELTGVTMLALITTDEVDLTFAGKRSVPRLGIRGRMDALVVVDPEQMPYAIEQITLDPQESVEVDITYTFTTEQLQELVGKGLYLDGFDPPREWVGIPMEFPTSVDVYVAPPLHEGDPPLVVTDLRRARFIDSSMEHSGYKFEEAFPDYRKELLEAGVLSEMDTPDSELSLSEVTGFDFGTEQAVLPVVVEPSGLDFDPEAIMSELRELSDREFEAPDQLRVLRADEQSRTTAGTGDLARAGLGSADDERINREFHTAMARSRSRLVGPDPVVETDRGVDEPSDEDLLAAFADGADADAGDTVDLADEFEGFDFGLLDGPDDTETSETIETPTATDPGHEDQATRDRQVTPTVAELLSGAGSDQQNPAEVTGTVDEALLELEEDDPSLVEDEQDSEREKARKAALRARRAAAQCARRARERAARQAAIQDQMDLDKGLVTEKVREVPGDKDTSTRARTRDEGPER